MRVPDHRFVRLEGERYLVALVAKQLRRIVEERGVLLHGQGGILAHDQELAGTDDLDAQQHV
ncbi:MAG TPA: hypothetical protein VHA56_16080 [Mucilaginibacter sp.]|nr:hypothetical protein [Mucilaginibacter sp.]